jgi:hypothetical protein
MIKRYSLQRYRQGAEEEYVLWTEHVEVVCKLRDKIMEFAKDCEPCGGTGIITVKDEDAPAFGRTLPCYACEDLRELLE